MPQNPHKPRRRNEVDQLPTHDGRELLASMIGVVGLRETARRLARTPTAVRHWHSGRIRVPEVVREWLVTAAANSRHTGSLDGVRWFYPRPRPVLRERHKALQAEIRSLWAETLRHEQQREWEEVLMEELDPYA